MESVIQDLRYAVRMLIKKPSFTVVVIAALALGIGANTAIFSIVNSILLKPLPYPDPGRLVMVWMDNKRMNVDQDIHSYPNYVDYRDQNEVFESLAAYYGVSVSLVGDGEPNANDLHCKLFIAGHQLHLRRLCRRWHRQPIGR